jgi:hypothetical protein
VSGLIASLFLLIGCVSVPGQPSGGSAGGPARDPAGGPASTALPASTRITPAPVTNPIKPGDDMIRVILPANGPVSLKVGQRINVQPPIASAWDVDFDARLLSLDPGITLGEPPTQGWIWVAQQKGETEIRFAAKAPPCDPKTQNCPNAPSFAATLKLLIAP